MFGLLVVAALVTTSVSHAGIILSDSAVFSTNSFGENWNGWIWNTQAPPADTPDRWNMYYSSSLDRQNPVFINSINDSSTNINLDLTAGTHTFLIYGETVTPTLHPEQHFVLNLYINGNQSAPDISGLYGPTCATVCAASHWNGLDLLGSSGLGGNLDAQEAGTLIYTSAGYQLELTSFTWDIDPGIDSVWSHWDDTIPYSGGSGSPDFVGEITLRVIAVPAAIALSHIPVVLTNSQLGRSKVLRRRLDSFADGIRFQNNLSGINTGDPGSSTGGFWNDGRNGMFIDASYIDFDRERDGSRYGYDGHTVSLTGGFDRKINERLTAGIAIGYDDIDSSAKKLGYSGDVETWGVSVYSRYMLPVEQSEFTWYVDGVLNYNDNDIDTRRSGNKGDTNADQFVAEVLIGAERRLNNGIMVSPYGGLQYINTDIDGYTETGLSALAYDDQNTHALYAVLGSDVGTEKNAGNGWTVRPNAYAELRAVLDDGGDDLKFGLAAVPGSTFKQTMQPFDDYALTLGLGIEGRQSENSSLYARISATVGDEDSLDYALSAGANFSF